MSLRDAADQVGISFNTLARIEKGRVPDVATFQRLAEWIGISPGEFFRPQQPRSQSTPGVIAAHLTADPALSDEAAGRIAAIVDELYGALARRDATMAVHLRSGRALPADAAVRLADIVVSMQHALEREDGAR
jgi:transcriptional regulator with XRE-family HTH domain